MSRMDHVPNSTQIEPFPTHQSQVTGKLIPKEEHDNDDNGYGSMDHSPENKQLENVENKKVNMSPFVRPIYFKYIHK